MSVSAALLPAKVFAQLVRLVARQADEEKRPITVAITITVGPEPEPKPNSLASTDKNETEWKDAKW